MGEIATEFAAAFAPGQPVSKRLVSALGDKIENALSGAVSNIIRFATVGAMNADTGRAAGQLAYVYANNASPADPLNTYYQWTGIAWVEASWFVAVQLSIGDAAIGDVVFTESNSFSAGLLAGRDTATTDYAVLLGHSTGFGLTNSNEAVVIGRSAGAGASGLIGAVVLGSSAAATSTTSGHSVVIGASAGYALIASDYAVVMGDTAAQLADTCPSGIFIGASAGRYANDCEHVIAIGTQALGHNDEVEVGATTYTEGDDCRSSIFIGYSAGRHTAANRYSIAMGYAAGEYSLESHRSIFLGRFAGIYAGTHENDLSVVIAPSEKSVMLGDEAGLNASASPGAVLIGSGAGRSEYTDSVHGIPLAAPRAVYIGNEAGAAARGTTDTVLIGPDTNAGAIANGVAVGAAANVQHARSVALGSSTTTTAADQVMVGGRDIEINDSGKGVILTAPNGTRYRLQVSNAGALTVTAA